MDKGKNKILFRLLLTYDSPDLRYHKEYEHISKALNKLIILVAKAENDIRYCSNEKCTCHPEHQIKELLNKDNRLISFLNENIPKTVRKLLYLCDNYKPIVAKGIYEDG